LPLSEVLLHVSSGIIKSLKKQIKYMVHLQSNLLGLGT
jgi:hypothetical protein